MVKSKCPCFARSELFQPGDVITEDCNECVCKNSAFVCTEKDCGGTCKLVGNGHITTFDNTQYTLGAMNSECDYTLLQKDDLQIVLHRDANFQNAVLLRWNNSQEILEVNRQLEVRYHYRKVLNFPYSGTEFTVNKSPFAAEIIFQNTTTISFDADSIYIHEATAEDSRVAGLCGTFTRMQVDDFKTPSVTEA